MRVGARIRIRVRVGVRVRIRVRFRVRVGVRVRIRVRVRVRVRGRVRGWTLGSVRDRSTIKTGGLYGAMNYRTSCPNITILLSLLIKRVQCKQTFPLFRSHSN